MTFSFEASVDEASARKVLAMLRDETDLGLVSYGDLAVDLQLPDAPSPHAVNLEASWVAGTLRLVFHTSQAEVGRRLDWLAERAPAHGVALELRSVD